MLIIPDGFKLANFAPAEHAQHCRWGSLLPIQDDGKQVAVICYECNRAWPVQVNRKLDEMSTADFVTGAQRHWDKHHPSPAKTAALIGKSYRCKQCDSTDGPFVITNMGTLCVACRKAQASQRPPAHRPAADMHRVRACRKAK